MKALLKLKHIFGGGITMKKSRIMPITALTLVLSVVMQLFLSTSCFAYYNQFVSNRYRNSSYFIDENTYSNINWDIITLTTEPASDWIYEQFNDIVKFKFISDPKEPILFIDFLRLIYDLQISSEPYKTYPRRQIEYEDLDENFRLINMIEILSGTGFWDAPSIVNGTPTDTGLRLNLYDPIQRDQIAKIIDIACNDWYKLEKGRKSISFKDINNSWAKDNIINAFEYGFVNGKGENIYEPDSYMSIEEAITLIYNITRSNNKYTINDFVSAINYSDVAKIIEVYDKSFSGTLASTLTDIPSYHDGRFLEYDFWSDSDFAKKNTVKYLDKNIYAYYSAGTQMYSGEDIYSVLSGRIGPITIIPPDVENLTVDEYGFIRFYGAAPGSYDIQIINEYGITDTLTLNVYSNPKDLTLMKDEPEIPLHFDGGNTLYLKVGESVDLEEYVKNVNGNLHIYCSNPKYVEFDGKSRLTLVKPTELMEESDAIYVSDDYSYRKLYIKQKKR